MNITEIILRPHQIPKLKNVLEQGIPEDWAEQYGQLALIRLQNIVNAVQQDNTTIRVSIIDVEHPKYNGISVCGLDCGKLKDPFTICQKSIASRYERDIAEKLGVVIGHVYSANEIFDKVK